MQGATESCGGCPQGVEVEMERAEGQGIYLGGRADRIDILG